MHPVQVISLGLQLLRQHGQRLLGTIGVAYAWLLPGMLLELPVGWLLMEAGGESMLWWLIPFILGMLVCWILGTAALLYRGAAVSRWVYLLGQGQPESLEESLGQLYPRKWRFFSLAVQVGLRLLGLYLLCAVVLAMILGGQIGELLLAPSPAAISAALGVGLLLVLGAMVGTYYWCARWLVAEVVLALEPNLNAAQAMQRSWQLSQQSLGWLLGTVGLTTLLSLPLAALTGYGEGSVVGILLTAAVGLVLTGLWQVLKGIVYGELCRRSALAASQ